DFAVKDFLAQGDRIGADGLLASAVVEAGVVWDELTGSVAPVCPGLSADGSATHAAPHEADQQVRRLILVAGTPDELAGGLAAREERGPLLEARLHALPEFVGNNPQLGRLEA